MSRLEMAKQRLEQYYRAETAILSSQSYSIGGKSLTRANLKEVQQMIETLENQILNLQNQSKVRKTRRVVPMDI